MGNSVAAVFSAQAGEDVLAGQVAPMASYAAVYTEITYWAIGAGVLLLILSKPLNKLMHGIK